MRGLFCAQAAALAALGMSVVGAQGSGFAIIEQSVSALGNAVAGGAAAAEDASTIFFNPAGMTHFTSPQINAGLHLISPTAKFKNQGSQTVVSNDPSATVSTQGFDADGGVDALVPNFYYLHPVSEKIVLGLGVHAPFGLVTDYDDGWVGRYVALRSDLATINLNPSVAFRLSPRLSFGLGASAQYADVELNNAINLAGAVGSPSIGSAAMDGKAIVSGDDWGYGFNAGLLFEFTEQTRLGFAFRSKIKHHMSGKAQFILPASLRESPLAAVFASQGAEASLTLPETLSLSVFHHLTHRTAVMADVTWTNWSRFDVLDVNFQNPVTEASAGGPIQEQWEDTFRYSVGMSYQLTDPLKLRLGVAYDESPAPNDQLRSPRIPDSDRLWLAAGMSYNLTEQVTLSAAYVRILVDDPVVDNSSHTPGQIIRGTIEASVNIFSLGGTLHF